MCLLCFSTTLISCFTAPNKVKLSWSIFTLAKSGTSRLSSNVVLFLNTDLGKCCLTCCAMYPNCVVSCVVPNLKSLIYLNLPS